MAAGNVGRAERSCSLYSGSDESRTTFRSIDLVALEVVLQVAELVARLAVDEEDLELLLADGDDPLDPVVVGLELAGPRIDLDDEGPLAGRLGPMDQLDALGLAVAGASTSLVSSSRSAFGIVRAGLALFEPDDDLLSLEAPGRQLGLEPDGVVDEDDVVDQELGQLEVAGRLGAAQADRVERHSLARRQLGRLGERLALGGLAVGEAARSPTAGRRAAR